MWTPIRVRIHERADIAEVVRDEYIGSVSQHRVVCSESSRVNRRPVLLRGPRTLGTRVKKKVEGATRKRGW